MQLMDGVFSPAERIHLELSTTKTTLYELIDAINAEVQPGEDQLVAEVVLHLIETGQAQLLDVDCNERSGWVL
jgi:predicted DNA-binding protein